MLSSIAHQLLICISVVVCCFAEPLQPITAGDTEDCVMIQDVIRKSKGEFLRPPTRPTPVELSIYIEKIRDINEADRHADICIYINAFWRDDRLAQTLHDQELKPCFYVFKFVAAGLLDKIWTPKLDFTSADRAQIAELPNVKRDFTYHVNGTLELSVKYSLVVPCYMNLRKFPMDTARCYVAISLAEDDVRRVPMSWVRDREVVTSLFPGVPRTAQHTLVKNMTYKRSLNDTYTPTEVLYLLLIFERLNGWYLLHAYTPSYLILFISWLYNTMGLETRTSRLQLRASLLLALMLLYSNIHRQIPKVGYVKALDVWLLLVLGFLLLSCIEDTVVTWLCNRIKNPALQMKDSMERGAMDMAVISRSETRESMNAFKPKSFIQGRLKKRRAPEETNNSNGTSSPTQLTDTRSSNRQFSPEQPFLVSPQSQMSFSEQHDRTYRNLALKIDTAYVFVYPILFIASNIAYWTYYGQGTAQR